MKTQSSAMKMVENAIKRGELTRPEQCEICTCRPRADKVQSIVAHHWNGYDHPLDIWWICRSCNRILAYKHDGSLNKEQAKKYIRRRQMEMLGYYSSEDFQAAGVL